MGLEVANRGGRYGLRAFCDCCGRETFDGECNVLTDRDIDDGASSPIKIACKGQCTNRIDPDRELANQELGRCIVHLLNNARVNLKAEIESEEFWRMVEG